MSKAIIYFSNNSTLELSAGDRITPITYLSALPDDKDELNFPSVNTTIEMTEHIHNGLIPSILKAFANCDFFYLNQNIDVAYNSKAIVRIESN